MQIDIHFYGTYAIARLAGFEKSDAETIATSAQFVDDATDDNSEKNEQEEMLFGICTAHHGKVAVATSILRKEKHRLVWVPFHFYPAGEGKDLHEKLLCLKDSEIVNQMFGNHIEMHAKVFYLHLLGIAAHAYIDTFAHYGFSGICSELNEIESGSIDLNDLKVTNPKIHKYIEDKSKKFWEKFKWELAGAFAEKASRGLGHGAVATYPDRPFLSWSFQYTKPRHGQGIESGERNNKETYLEGLTKLYDHFVCAAKKKYASPKKLPFDQDAIKNVLAIEAKKEGRIDKWKEFINKHCDDDDKSADYHGKAWEKQKGDFENTMAPDHIGDCYRFHQAAAYHRWYTLKDLLPEHGIYVV